MTVVDDSIFWLRLTVFKMGPDILRLEESTETTAGGRPSSPPLRQYRKSPYRPKDKLKAI